MKTSLMFLSCSAELTSCNQFRALVELGKTELKDIY